MKNARTIPMSLRLAVGPQARRRPTCEHGNDSSLATATLHATSARFRHPSSSSIARSRVGLRRACGPTAKLAGGHLGIGLSLRIAMVAFVVLASASMLSAAPIVIIVEGAPGAEEYGPQFSQWRLRWEEAAKDGGAMVHSISPSNQVSDKSDRDRIKEALTPLAGEGKDELWLVLLGHGTHDGKHARFNLQGPDVSADELSQWLAPIQRPVAIINCFSSSGPFMTALSGANRVILTATRSGHELNFSRFGGFLSQYISDATADLDKDGQTSLLEAYLLASRRTQEWYKEEGRLATEHALIDDNADGLGTPAEWFIGVRAVKKAKDDTPLDGLRAKQWCLVRSERERKMPPELRAKRDAIELRIDLLRNEKASMSEDVYFARLEAKLIELAKLSAVAEKE